MAAPTAKSSGTQTTNFILSGTSVAVSEAPGAAAGDGYLMFAVCSAGNTLSMTGWTTILANTTVGGANVAIWGFPNRGGSAPSLTVTCSTTDYIEALMYQWSGGDTSAPFFGFTSANNSGGTNPDPPASGTVASNDYLAICGGLNWDTGGAFTAPSTYSNLVSIAQSSEDLVLASKQLTAATSENPGAFGGGIGASTSCWGFTILIAPAAAGGLATIVPFDDSSVVPQRSGWQARRRTNTAGASFVSVVSGVSAPSWVDTSYPSRLVAPRRLSTPPTAPMGLEKWASTPVPSVTTPPLPPVRRQLPAAQRRPHDWRSEALPQLASTPVPSVTVSPLPPVRRQLDRRDRLASAFVTVVAAASTPTVDGWGGPSPSRPLTRPAPRQTPFFFEWLEWMMGGAAGFLGPDNPPARAPRNVGSTANWQSTDNSLLTGVVATPTGWYPTMPDLVARRATVRVVGTDWPALDVASEIGDIPDTTYPDYVLRRRVVVQDTSVGVISTAQAALPDVSWYGWQPDRVRGVGRVPWFVSEHRAETVTVSAPDPWPSYPARTWRPVLANQGGLFYADQALVINLPPIPDVPQPGPVRRLSSLPALFVSSWEMRADTTAVTAPNPTVTLPDWRLWRAVQRETAGLFYADQGLTVVLTPIPDSPQPGPVRRRPLFLSPAEMRADTTTVTAPNPTVTTPDYRLWRTLGRETAGMFYADQTLGAAAFVPVLDPVIVIPVRRLVRVQPIVPTPVDLELPFPPIPDVSAVRQLRGPRAPWQHAPKVVAHEAVVVVPSLSWLNKYPDRALRARLPNAGASLSFVPFVPFSTIFDPRRVIRVKPGGAVLKVPKRGRGLDVPPRDPKIGLEG